VVWQFELSETQFVRTVRDKIGCKTHLELENDCFKYIFGILIKFSFQWHKKPLQNHVKSERKVVWKFELSETQFVRTVRDKIACKTHLEQESDYFQHIFGILIKFSIQ